MLRDDIQAAFRQCRTWQSEFELVHAVSVQPIARGERRGKASWVQIAPIVDDLRREGLVEFDRLRGWRATPAVIEVQGSLF